MTPNWKSAKGTALLERLERRMARVSAEEAVNPAGPWMG